MPGREGGDRIHNFFDQEKLSYQHSHPQVVDGSRLVSSNFHWPGNQRCESSPLNFSSAHTASNTDRDNLDQQPSLVHSSPFLQSPHRPTFAVSTNLIQHTSLNGYIHDHHPVQAKNDKTDFIGMNRESSPQSSFSRGLLNSGAQFRNVYEQHKDTRQETTESPVNFNFLGSHQQLNSQQLGTLHSSPRQQSGLNERQLLQQQAMLRNLYDVHKQQQLQKQDTRQMNTGNNLSIGHQSPNDRSTSLNSTSFQDGSNYAWMPQHGNENPSWHQGIVSPVMHGTPNEILFSTEQSAPQHIFGFSPQSADHSLYEFPVSNTRGPSSQLSHSMEKPISLSQHVPTESIPLPANRYGSLLGQVSAQDEEMGSRFGFQKNNSLPNALSKLGYPGTVMGNLSQAESQLRIHGMPSSSMNSKENTLSQAFILEDAAPLDPTEEQFLFGSDDNIWDVFGKSSISKLDDNSMVEGSEFQNQFPSMQSGSWSALMQSALAETCGDTGNQQKWSGLNRSGKPASADESLAFIGSEKHRTSFTNSNMHVEPSLDVNQYMSLEKTGATNTFDNEKIQFNSTAKSSQQVSEGNRRSDHSNLKAHPDENTTNIIYGHHPAAALNLKGPSSAWAPQHGTSLKTTGNQVHNKSSHDTYMGYEPGNGSIVRSTSDENIMNPIYDGDGRFGHEEKLKDKSAWTRNSYLNSQSLNSNSHIVTGPTTNSLLDNFHGSQNPPISHHYNHWKHVVSIPEVRSENMAKAHHPPDANPHVLDSSFNSSDKKSQQQSSFWDTTSGNKLKDSFVSDQRNPNVIDEKQRVSDQVAGCSPGTRKCQSHSSRQEPKVSSQNDKGKGSNHHIDMHKLHEKSSVGYSMHHLANKTYQSSENMVERINKAVQSRENSAEASRNSSEQNMLSEKPAAESPDTSMSPSQQNHILGSRTYSLQLGPPHQRSPTQSRSQSPALSSLGLNSGQFEQHHSSARSPAELNDARSGVLGQWGDSDSLHHVQKHSSASGPPNLGNQPKNQQAHEGHMSSNPFMRPDTMLSPLDHADTMLAKASIMQSSRGPQFKAMGSNMNPAPLLSSSSEADKNILSSLRPKHMGFPSAWTNVPNQQGSSQPDIFTSQSHMKTFVDPVKKDELNQAVSGNDSPGSGVPNTIYTTKSLGEDQRAIGRSCKSGRPDETCSELNSANLPGKDGFPFSDAVNPANLKISGNSVKSDVKPQNSYSLLHQLQVMRSTETDPNNRDSKRQRVQSSSTDTQQSPSSFGQHQSLFFPTVTETGKSNSAVPGDYKLENFISVPIISQGRYMPSQPGSASFQKTPNFGQSDPKNSSVVTGKLLTHISPQMAPTWFERYGSLNREQLVPASDVWKHSLSQPSVIGQTPEYSPTFFLAQNHVQQVSALSLPNQVGDMKHCSAPEHIVIEHSSSPQMSAVTSPSLVSAVPHKLETATLELLPWYKEVTQLCFRGLPNISASEVKWANATKRIPEKVLDEVEQADNRSVKCRRRLVLTTQLMQQLLDPPPASVMSSDAYMSSESVVYFTSRLACGRACSLSGSSSDYSNKIYQKVPEQVDHLLSKVENDFLARASKMENALSSLENQTSIQELQIEWQDVEKFSVINRFAKFHGRGQADGPAITDSAMNFQNHGPQRYVTALPSPRNLPDSVQCLSL